MTPTQINILASALSAVGAALVLWGLFRDRARGRRRCPRCWYDMAGTPGLRCPECGREARGERGLFRTRRRWRLAAVGTLLLMSAPALHRSRDVAANGWPAAVPTTLLLLSMKWLEAPPEPTYAMLEEEPLGVRQRLFRELFERRAGRADMWRWQRTWLIERCVEGDSRRPQGSAAWRAACVPTLHLLDRNAAIHDLPNPMRDQLLQYWTDARAVPLTSRQRQRVFEGQVFASIDTRKEWPVGVPVRFLLDSDATPTFGDREVMLKARLPAAEAVQGQFCHSFYFTTGSIDLSEALRHAVRWDDETHLLGIPSEPQNGIIIDLTIVEYPAFSDDDGLRVVHEGPLRLPILIQGSPEDIVKPFESAAIEGALRDMFAPVLREWMWYRHPATLAPLRFENSRAADEIQRAAALQPGLVLALRFELCRRGEIMATGEAWWRPHRRFSRTDQGSPFGSLVHLHPHATRSLADIGELSDWTVRLIGDPAVALRDFEATHYWKGEIEVPLEESPAHAR